jgi:hypothetical protein
MAERKGGRQRGMKAKRRQEGRRLVRRRKAKRREEGRQRGREAKRRQEGRLV